MRLSSTELNYSGSGCPTGSVAVLFSPDEKVISVLFDTYKVSTTPQNSHDEKECTITIPFTLPPKQAMTILSVDYRGYNFLSEKSSSQFLSDYGIQEIDSHHTHNAKTIKGPKDEEYFDTNHENVTSHCGGKGILEIRTVLKIDSPKNTQESSFFVIDSSDVKSSNGRREKKERPIKYKIKMKPCKPK